MTENGMSSTCVWAIGQPTGVHNWPSVYESLSSGQGSDAGALLHESGSTRQGSKPISCWRDCGLELTIAAQGKRVSERRRGKVRQGEA